MDIMMEASKERRDRNITRLLKMSRKNVMKPQKIYPDREQIDSPPCIFYQ